LLIDGVECQSAILNFNHKKNGDVAKWQGKGLQNPDHGSKSHRRLWKSEPNGSLFSFGVIEFLTICLLPYK
jgi:hypothetical protein